MSGGAVIRTFTVSIDCQYTESKKEVTATFCVQLSYF